MTQKELLYIEDAITHESNVIKICEDMGASYDVMDIPAELQEKAQKARAELLDAVVEFDDKAMEEYLEGKEPDVETLKKCIRKGTLAMKIFPVFCGSSFKNKGVQPLLNAIVDYLPSPVDIEHITGKNPRTGEEETQP